MAEVFIISDNIYSPVGTTAAENFMQLKNDVSGIQLHNNKGMSEEPFYASLFDQLHFFIADEKNIYTKFEQLLIVSIADALKDSGIQANDPETILIISSTKGNISLLETGVVDGSLTNRVALPGSVKKIAEYFGFIHHPVVTSNACISGLLGITIGKRLIESGQYKNAVVAGADVISKFILSGFQAFQAVSSEPCKPFDANRSGITLGEAAATVILSSSKQLSKGIQVMAGAVSNDANHISAPSRTGAELAHIITSVLADSDLSPNQIDFISAHGTATLYNDEMETKAISLAELATIPVNSLKGYYGHTLGAAGLVESIISTRSLSENIVLPTRGFDTPGVGTSLNICHTILHTPLKNCLKTASGFGGCNAAIVFSKHHN